MRGHLLALGLALVLVAAPLATAHKTNHMSAHEDCDIYGPPHGHFVGDGHDHTHNKSSTLHDHEPCKQVRMAYPDYEPVAPIVERAPPVEEVTLEKLIFDDGNPNTTSFYVYGEAYTLPIHEDSVKQRDILVIGSNAQAKALAQEGLIYGSGTKDDPYIVENFTINRTMIIRDTSDCFVVRNNVVVDRFIEAPLPTPPGPDGPLPIISVPDLLKTLNDTIAKLQETIDNVTKQLQDLEADKAVEDALMAAMDAEALDLEAQRKDLEDEKKRREAELAPLRSERDSLAAAIASYEGALLEAVQDTEQLSKDFEFYVEQILKYDPTTITQPDKLHRAYISDDTVTDAQALQSSFQKYQDEASALAGAVSEDGVDANETVRDVRDVVEGNPPGSSPPPNYGAGQSQWEADVMQYESYQQEILSQIQGYWDALAPTEPDYERKSQLDDQIAAKEASYAEFMVTYEAFVLDHEAFLADYASAQVAYDDFLAVHAADTAALNDVLSVAEVDIEAARDLVSRLGDAAFTIGENIFQTIDDLIEFLLDLLDPDREQPNQNNDGQMVFDWNGQCLHVYNNVIEDLRVNQNNDRTGEATGGVMENNRMFEIGQIRHYDGIFRNNEVGNRAHLYSLVDPSISPPGGRTVNNDGANQGWYFDNVFYGQIDLDFHGHHHSPGFFANESHYHGSTYNVAYMVGANGACSATYDQVPNGREYDDNDWHLLGEVVVDRADSYNCLPHHDHAKRWTSVFFTNNVIVDPNGVGLRFEDRDHRADDEQANSENMVELKKPHFHQKWVQVENNSIVGKFFVDVLNAKGTLLWSDDWSEVENPSGVERTQEALRHPGARIVYSHPLRNDAWLDVQNNTFFQTQSTSVLVSGAEFMTKFQLENNRAFGLPSGQSNLSFEDLRDFLWDTRNLGLDGSDIQEVLDGWSGSDRGAQTFAVVRNAIDAFHIEFCGNELSGLDASLVATDRIYQDGHSTIKDCGDNELGDAAAAKVQWTPAPTDRPKFSEPLRALTGNTDSYYILDLAYEMADAFLPAAPVQI